MRKLLFILLLSSLRMCGVTPAFGQLTAPVKHFPDTTKYESDDSLYVFTGKEVVNLANDELLLDQLKVEKAILDSITKAQANEIKVHQQKQWSYATLVASMNREADMRERQIKNSEKQIEFLQQTINDYKPSFFDKYKGEIGFLLGIIGGIAIVKLLK